MAEQQATFANLTPFAAAKVVNKVLELKGIDHSVTPQMMYGYARSQRIETVPNSKPILFVGSAFKTWLDEYVSKVERGESSRRVDYDKLADQFM